MSVDAITSICHFKDRAKKTFSVFKHVMQGADNFTQTDNNDTE